MGWRFLKMTSAPTEIDRLLAPLVVSSLLWWRPLHRLRHRSSRRLCVFIKQTVYVSNYSSNAFASF